MSIHPVVSCLRLTRMGVSKKLLSKITLIMGVSNFSGWNGDQLLTPILSEENKKKKKAYSHSRL